ncbi:hypothetical protein LXA43DRAFT_1093887 [Ganoderma leucocontextum]|nr:hypothetical protein LXA43DRAFT_1093887 [Ganoderma leucocontextum]
MDDPKLEGSLSSTDQVATPALRALWYSHLHLNHPIAVIPHLEHFPTPLTPIRNHFTGLFCANLSLKMFRVADTLGPTTATEMLPEGLNIYIQPREPNEDGLWEKDVNSSPITSCNEAQRSPFLSPDSLEDIVVEKWVCELSNPAADEVAAPKRVAWNERAKGARYNPLSSQSKENRKTRSSVSYTTVLPYKRDIPRSALVQLRYRHYYPNSNRGAESRVQNRKSLVYIPRGPSAVPRESFHPDSDALDQCISQSEYGGAPDGDYDALAQHTPQAYLEVHNRTLEGCLPERGEREVFAATADENFFDGLDLEWTRERFAQASISDDYDSDMTDH